MTAPPDPKRIVDDVLAGCSVTTRFWLHDVARERVCAAWGVPEDWLPAFYCGVFNVGEYEVTPGEAAELAGLPADLSLPDFITALIEHDDEEEL